MDGDVEPAAGQRRLDLLGEQALAPHLGQRPILDAVAGRGDGDDVDGRRGCAPRRLKTRLDFIRLGEGERAATGTEANGF